MGKYLSTDQKPLKTLNLIGIFSIFFFVAFLATYFYSPVIRTNASESDTVTVGAEIEDVVSVSLSSNELNFEFTPTPSGVFDSKYVDASVKTNTFGGYELYFSSVDDETNMKSSTTSDTISSDFSGTVTGTNMESNKWGYSLDTTSAILDKEYTIIPALSNRVTLANTSSSTPGVAETKRVYIGVKVNSKLKSGTYEKTLKFTGVAHKSPTVVFGGITTVQEMTSTICAEAKINDSSTLRDRRDGNTYTIAKLKDEKCWMTENLKIMDKELTSLDSDVSSDFTVPESSISAFKNIYDQNSAYLDTTYGGYYSWYTATAGTGTASMTSGNASSSICPKGWRLPTGGSGGEFEDLYRQYNSSSLILNPPFNFAFYSFIDNGANRHSSDGGLWSSTAHSGNFAHNLAVNSSNVYPTNGDYKYRGFPIRCLAK